LASAGYQVHALSSPGPELDAFVERTGVVPHGVDMVRDISPHDDLRALRGFIRELRTIDPDIVHAHTPKAGLLAMIAAALLRVPVRVYHCHGLRFETATGLKRALLRAAERLSCWLATHVLTVSASVREALVAAQLARPGKVEVLHSGSIGGVDPNRFAPSLGQRRAEAKASLRIPAHATVIGFVGRVVKDKGVVELAEAWRRLRQRFHDAHLVVGGPVEDGDPVPEQVLDELRSDPRVRICGLTPDTAPLYAAMDVFALPSYREGFGVVSLEAAAMGLPVVATRIVGCVDAVVEGVTGTLVEPRSSEQLEAALARYLADPGLREQHGESGRARALEHFRPEAFWAALQDRYARWLPSDTVPVVEPVRHARSA
jgi:glycosyltransferase involved in cell wall biosynthesis